MNTLLEIPPLNPKSKNIMCYKLAWQCTICQLYHNMFYIALLIFERMLYKKVLSIRVYRD